MNNEQFTQLTSYFVSALIVFLGTVAVQGYGPKINRKRNGIPPKPTQRFSSHGFRRGPPWRPPGFPNHWSGPPNKHKPVDNSPQWNDRSSGSSDDGSDSYDSYSQEDSVSPSRDHSDSYDDNSSDDYSDWHNHHRPNHNNV